MHEIPAMSERALELRTRLLEFMDQEIYPREEEMWRLALERHEDRWEPLPQVEELKALARERGLWNLFLPESEHGAGLSNRDYASLAEIMGRTMWASEAFNCNAPDTGNMEVLVRYGTPEQKERWLEPLLDGTIRSAFAMTEPDVASSDATNIAAHITRDGDHFVINARKWWTSGACDPRCKILIFMGKTSPDDPNRHRQQSMILIPMDTPGVVVERPLRVFGFDDAPHGHAEVSFTNVRVPVENLLLGEGRGFEIAQGRLGPGRIHHCMRWIGICERAFDLMCKRAVAREIAPGKPLATRQMVQDFIAESRAEIDAARLYVEHVADVIDQKGTHAARTEISCIKFFVANILQKVLDRAIQVHGALGITDDLPLSHLFRHERGARIYDGPDEVHKASVARRILRGYGLELGSIG